MSAQLVLCGDPPVGVGGEFELECARELRDNLPDGFVIATNVHLPRGGGGEFYECDAVLPAPGVCDILEVKCIRPDAIVWEDLLSSETGFSIDRVFSKLDDKAKVLSSRRKESPFPSGAQHRSVWVRWQVVVPSNTRITFKVPMHAKSKSVLTLADTVQKYRSVAASVPPFSRCRCSARESQWLDGIPKSVLSGAAQDLTASRSVRYSQANTSTKRCLRVLCCTRASLARWRCCYENFHSTQPFPLRSFKATCERLPARQRC